MKLQSATLTILAATACGGANHATTTVAVTANVATPTPTTAPTPQTSYVLDDGKLSSVSFVGDSAFLVEDDRIALVTDHGLDWKTYSSGLDAARQQNESFEFTHVIGSSLKNLWLETVRDTRMGETKIYLHFENGTWKQAWPQTADGNVYIGSLVATENGAIAQWVPQQMDGMAMGDIDESAPPIAPPGGKWLVAIGGEAPPLEGKGFTASKIVPFGSGEVWAFGSLCMAHKPDKNGEMPPPDCALQVRRWKPGGKLIIDAIPGDPQTAAYGFNSFIAASPTDAYLQLADSYLHFDGKSWQPFTWGGKANNGNLHRSSVDGSLWSVVSADGKNFIERRSTDGKITSMPMPLLGTVSDLDGIEVGAPWAVLGDDKVARYDAATNAWITMTIPRPPADLATTMTAPRVISIAVHTPHDVWIAVAYEDVAADGQDTSGDMPDGGPPSHGAMLHITDPAQLK